MELFYSHLSTEGHRSVRAHISLSKTDGQPLSV